MKILALSGSLRAASINSALLRVAAALAPPGMTVAVFEGVGELPLFNPDREASPPPVVTELRTQVEQADALLIASPEYAHGVTGAIKNALDWLVSFEPFTNKPVAVLNASARAHHADDALRETLMTMNAAIVVPASLAIPITPSTRDEAGMIADPAIVAAVHAALASLREAVGHGGADDRR